MGVMSLKDAERNLKGMGETIARNMPGPAQLAEGFRQAIYPVLPLWGLIAFILLFGEPIARWLAHG
jgi:hypothetical protein